MAATQKQTTTQAGRRGKTPLVSEGFLKVTHKRRCRVCGKPDWCGYSKDEKTSICMRVSDGSRRMAKNGGYIHVHDEEGEINAPTAKKRKSAKSEPAIECAPLEVRDAVYREIIRLSPSTRYYELLVSGPGGLLSRGFTESMAVRYGALPPSQKERAALARDIRQFVMCRFPEYGRLNSHAGVVGIPGFWQDKSGVVQLWKPRDYNKPMLVIPYENADGFIGGCQLRRHPSDTTDGEKKYCWLASPLERRGTSSGTPLHFTFRPAGYSAGQTVVITEGALKADAFVSLRPNARVIATSGVSCAHPEMIDGARGYNVLVAFDADHRTNPAVCRQLGRLIAGRERDSASRGLKTTTKIVFWDGPKGIDEAAQFGVPLTAIGIHDWFSTLKDEPLEQVKKVWDEMKYSPRPPAHTTSPPAVAVAG